MAILKFRVYLEEDESVYRDVLISHKQHFLQLHEAILKAYEFDAKHQATFYRSNDNWQRGKEITLQKYDKSYKADPLLMETTLIGSEIIDPNQKFIYVYDFIKNWTFQLELINITKEGNPKITYPSIARSEGVAPPQYGTKGAANDKLAEMEEKYDLKSGAEGFGEVDEDGESTGDEYTAEADEESSDE